MLCGSGKLPGQFGIAGRIIGQIRLPPVIGQAAALSRIERRAA